MVLQLVSFGSTILEIYVGLKLVVSLYNQLTNNYFRAVTVGLLAGADLNARNFHIVGCVAIIQTCMLPIFSVGVSIHIFNFIAVPVGGVIISVRRNNRALTSTLFFPYTA